MADPAERRKYPRWPIMVEVTMDSEHAFIGQDQPHTSRDISPGGVFVAARCPQPRGTRLRVQFTLPDSADPIHAEGEVQWVKDASGEGAAGMGLRFIKIDPEDLARIEHFIKQLDST